MLQVKQLGLLPTIRDVHLPAHIGTYALAVIRGRAAHIAGYALAGVGEIPDGSDPGRVIR
jgi:hypothetical protein